MTIQSGNSVTAENTYGDWKHSGKDSPAFLFFPPSSANLHWLATGEGEVLVKREEAEKHSQSSENDIDPERLRIIIETLFDTKHKMKP